MQPHSACPSLPTRDRGGIFWPRILSTGWLALASGAAFAALTPGHDITLNCSWDRPGVDPFMGDVVATVDGYGDIPADTRSRLKLRMARRDYDDIATIRRDSLQGAQDYDPQLRDMHFGNGQVCASVSRAAWSESHQERGLVYCEDGHCIIVPTVCRNVSRVTRRSAPAAGAMGPTAAAAPETELVFAPPGAGLAKPGALDGLAGPLSVPADGDVIAATATATATTLVAAAPIIDSRWLGPVFSAAGLPARLVPEPAIWLSMIAGLAVVWRKLRRQCH